MLFEEVVEFELIGSRPLIVHTVFQKLIIFKTKQKSPRQIFE